MNETKWLMYDDDFFIVSRRWFENWKGFVSYDYVLKKIVTEQKKVSDLSLNQIILSGRNHPGEVSNWSLILEGGKYYQRYGTREDPTFTPLRENISDGKEFFMVPKGVWKCFHIAYKGVEIRRHSVVKNRNGQLFRHVGVPLLRICLVRRGDSIRPPKYIPLLLRTTIEKLKIQLTQIFPQITSDWGCNKENLNRELRCWLLTNEMPTNEFIELYNQEMSQSKDQSFNFPGVSLELRYNKRQSNREG